MPKLIDYAGRFAFFEEACFVVVRDHGPQHLSRYRLAQVLGTSISTVRRLLRSEADLRNLALTEVGHRRRRGRYGQPPGEGLDAALWLLRRLIPDTPQRIAVATYGFVPMDVLQLRIEPPMSPQDPEGRTDPVVDAHPLHTVVEGVGIGMCLGRLAPEEAVGILRGQLEGLTSGGSSSACP